MTLRLFVSKLPDKRILFTEASMLPSKTWQVKDPNKASIQNGRSWLVQWTEGGYPTFAFGNKQGIYHLSLKKKWTLISGCLSHLSSADGSEARAAEGLPGAGTRLVEGSAWVGKPGESLRGRVPKVGHVGFQVRRGEGTFLVV